MLLSIFVGKQNAAPKKLQDIEGPIPDPVWCGRIHQIIMYVSYGYQLKKSSTNRKMNNILQISVHRANFDVCLG